MYNNIFLFVKIITAGNFSIAAKTLAISQSTLSKKIQRLEEDLQIKLINRDSRHFNITERGNNFYQNFKPVENEIHELLKTEFGLHINTFELFDEIVVFNQLLKLGNYTEYVKTFNIPRSTLSRKIKDLENKFGCPLLIRDSHKTITTSKGSLLFSKFIVYENKLSSILKSTLYDIKSSKKGSLNVLLPFSLSQDIILPNLGKFLRQYPELEISITSYTFSSSPFNINAHKYDIAIINYTPNQQTQKIRKIGSDKVIIVCNKEYISKYGHLERLEDISNHLIIGKSNTDGTKEQYIPLYDEAKGEIFKIPNKFRVYVSSFSESRQLTLKSEIISGLPYSTIYNELESGELVRLLPDYHLGIINYYLMKTLDDSDPKLRAFVNFLQECMTRMNQYSSSDFPKEQIWYK